jgi:EAL domain-containing protein (putative c-di-GMP-specific phosphodiesterase class I)/CheY-like chemotaxis protein
MMNEYESLKILVVDDDPFVLKLLAHQLASVGCRAVRTFERAQAALTHIETRDVAVDMILCDLDMPQMDGVEFVRKLVRTQFTGGLVLVSGENKRILHAAEQLARAHRLRVLGALAKPVSQADLQRMLDRYLEEPTVPRSVRKSYSAEELSQAIEHGDLYCEYQPLVEVATGRLVGVETLVRWRHASDGTVYPDQFIGVAEEHGLIDRLTDLVLTQALQQCRAWRREGLYLKVSVNVSMDNMGTLSFPDAVMGKVAAAGIDASSLTLEVTESQLMKDRRSSLDILTRLRLKDIGLSIDDFGTGHSSLVQLRDVPFDELKIDRSFVHGADHDRSLRAIFNGNVAMAEQLDMRIVAEGVEDAADWGFLCATGCSLAQGYFIGRPMRPEALASWLKSWRARYRVLAAELPEDDRGPR